MASHPDHHHHCLFFPCAEAPSFDIVFEGLSSGLFWALFLAHGGLGLYHVQRNDQWRMLQRWPLYLMMLAYIVVTCISESVALGYTVDAQAGKQTACTSHSGLGDLTPAPCHATRPLLPCHHGPGSLYRTLHAELLCTLR